MSEVEKFPRKDITLWDIANLIIELNETLSEVIELQALQGKRMTLLSEYIDRLAKSLNNKLRDN